MKKNLIPAVVYIASLSGGKDSVAMVLRLIAEGWPLDCVVFYDGGMEFKALYAVVDKIERLCDARGIRFVRLFPSKSFEYMAFEKSVVTKLGTNKIGYSWCGSTCRWATVMKLSAISKFYKQYAGSFVIEYVGIAADETQRLWSCRKRRCTGSVKLYPLVEWKMTEADCLRFCHSHGYYWKERADLPDLYELLDRLSCFCCRNKNLKELKNMYLYLPEYWERLKAMQAKTSLPFYKGQLTIGELEKRFAREVGGELYEAS